MERSLRREVAPVHWRIDYRVTGLLVELSIPPFIRAIGHTYPFWTAVDKPAAWQVHFSVVVAASGTLTGPLFVALSRPENDSRMRTEVAVHIIERADGAMTLFHRLCPNLSNRVTPCAKEESEDSHT